MIKIKDQVIKTQVNQRLARIEGQLRGVQKMINDDRDCKEVIQQLIAIRAAIQAASLTFMQDVASECLLNLEEEYDPDEQRAMLTDVIQMLGKIS